MLCAHKTTIMEPIKAKYDALPVCISNIYSRDSVCNNTKGHRLKQTAILEDSVRYYQNVSNGRSDKYSESRKEKKTVYVNLSHLKCSNLLEEMEPFFYIILLAYKISLDKQVQNIFLKNFGETWRIQILI